MCRLAFDYRALENFTLGIYTIPSVHPHADVQFLPEQGDDKHVPGPRTFLGVTMTLSTVNPHSSTGVKSKSLEITSVVLDHVRCIEREKILFTSSTLPERCANAPIFPACLKGWC
jgi:hypothetical protein